MKKLHKLFSFALALIIITMSLPATTFGAVEIELLPHNFYTIKEFNEGMAAVTLSRDGKYGFINKSLQVVIPPKYDNVKSFSESMAAVTIDHKWGFIDKSGKEVVPPKYDGVLSFYNGLAVVWNITYHTIPNKNNENIVNVTGIDYKYGFIDKTGKEVVPLIYSRVGGRKIGDPRQGYHGYVYQEYFVNDVAVVWLDDKCGFVDKQGNEVTPIKYSDARWFSEGMIPVKLDEKWGFVNDKGEEVAPPKYDYVQDFYKDGRAAVEDSNHKYGFIDKSGKEVIPLKFRFNINSSYIDEPDRFSDGRLKIWYFVGKDKNGFIDETGNIIIKPIYQEAKPFSEGMAAVMLNDKWGFIDTFGNKIVPFKYDAVNSFTEDMAAVKLNGKWGFVDKSGNEVVPLIYDRVRPFTEGMAPVNLGGSDWGLGGKWGFIDKSGNEVVPLIYDNAGPFCEGLAQVYLNNKGGYIDNLGNEVIPLKYLGAGSFKNGLAWVSLDNSFEKCLINKNGKELTPIRWYLDYGQPLIGNTLNVLSYDTKGSHSTNYDILNIKYPPVTAHPTESKITIGSNEFTFGTYSIDGRDYFKINDLAYSLKGTAAEFSKEFVNGEMVITKGGAYFPSGDEMASVGTEDKEALPVLLDTIVTNPGYKWIELPAYSIDEFNYVVLKDFAESMDLCITSTNGSIVINVDNDIT